MRSIYFGIVVLKESRAGEGLEPVFVRKCSFQVCSVFILARRGYKVGLVEIGVLGSSSRKLKSWAFRASSLDNSTFSIFSSKSNLRNLIHYHIKSKV